MLRFRLLSAAAALLLAISIPSGLGASQRQTGNEDSAKQNEVPKPAAGDPAAKGVGGQPAAQSEEQRASGRQAQSPGPAAGQQPQRGPRRYSPPYLLDLAGKPAEEQERTLQADPLFRAATSEVQQRIRADLKRYTEMSPEERQKRRERFAQPQPGQRQQGPPPGGDRSGPPRYRPPYLLDLAGKPADEQERTLQADPLFRAATTEVQQRIREDLQRFTRMTPEERQRGRERFGPPPQAGQQPGPRPDGDRSGPRRYMPPPYLLDLAGKPADEQERTLQADPLFRAATPEVQQRIREDLRRFTQMTPEERARWRARFGPPPQVGQQQRRPDGDRSGQRHHMPPYLFELAGKPPQEQERILTADPHFRAMPSDVQRRIREDLKRISQMSPEERKQLGERFDAFHQLPPEARDVIRKEIFPVWTKLPPERQEAVKKEFRTLREMKPVARQARYLQIDFCKQFSPQEQQLLKKWVAVSSR